MGSPRSPTLQFATEPFSLSAPSVAGLVEGSMDTTTLLIILIVVLILFGGGWYGRGRWF
jgi:hypothetical protein